MAKTIHTEDELKRIIIGLESELSALKNKFAQTAAFVDKILNSLPGIFYLYQKSGDNFNLKKWNKNHMTLLGYSGAELLNKKPEDFFDQESIPVIKKGIQDIFASKGSVQVKANILTKTNQKIPYLFEGYYFEDEGSLFFLGMGIDISMQTKTQSDLIRFAELNKKQLIEKNRLNNELQEKKRELVSYALQMSKAGEAISSTQKSIAGLQKTYGENNLLTEVNILLRNMQKDSSSNLSWETFMNQFTKLHKDFFTKLKASCPALTKSEVKFCALLRLQMSSNQMATSLNVTNEAIRKSRYRIRKKLQLHPKDSLEEFLMKF